MADPDTNPGAKPRSAGIGAGLAAATREARRSLLRNHGGGHAPVSYLELFFDLVYVFAITQLSHFLHEHLSWLGFAQGMVLFLAMWWAWVYTTWVANWANPERLPVRTLLVVLMLLSMVMAVAVPQAYGNNAALFAGSYVALQIGRTIWMGLIFRRENRANALNLARIAVWFVASAVFWAIGALRSDDERLGWWLLALTIEYAGPIAFFRVPGMGRSSADNWDISGSHMAERCALFIIIALGEGIVVIGAAYAGLETSAGRNAAFLLAFLSSVTMWWLYFDIGAERGSKHIENHSNAGLIARNAYTYLHMPIVAGIVIYAVADALVIEHWNEPAGQPLIVAQCGGALVYLSGLGLFKRNANRFHNFPFSHIIGALLIAVLAAVGWFVPIRTLAFAGAGTAILALIALWEWVSYHGGWVERMDARGWRLAKVLKRRAEARQIAREARETA